MSKGRVLRVPTGSVGGLTLYCSRSEILKQCQWADFNPRIAVRACLCNHPPCSSIGTEKLKGLYKNEKDAIPRVVSTDHAFFLGYTHWNATWRQSSKYYQVTRKWVKTPTVCCTCRFNNATHCLGAGIRVGGHEIDGRMYGQFNNVRYLLSMNLVLFTPPSSVVVQLDIIFSGQHLHNLVRHVACQKR